MQPRERAPCCSAWLALEAVVMTNESALMCAYVQAMPAACSVCGHSHATRTQTAPCSRGRGSGVAVEQGHRARPRGTCAGRGAAAHLERLESLLLGPRVHHHHAEALGRMRGAGAGPGCLPQHARDDARVGKRQHHVPVVHLCHPGGVQSPGSAWLVELDVWGALPTAPCAHLVHGQAREPDVRLVDACEGKLPDLPHQLLLGLCLRHLGWHLHQQCPNVEATARRRLPAVAARAAPWRSKAAATAPPLAPPL